MVFRGGSVLYRAGEEGMAVYRLHAGAVKLTRMFPDGDARIVHIAHAGDFVGLEALVQGRFRHQATVLYEVEACRLPAHRLEQCMVGMPDLTRLLMRQWQQALDDAYAWLASFTTGTAIKRLARYLLHYAGRAGSDTVLMPLTRRDLAAIVGLTTETVSRTMARMRRAGLVQQIGRGGLKLDLPALQGVLDSEEGWADCSVHPRSLPACTGGRGPDSRAGRSSTVVTDSGRHPLEPAEPDTCSKRENPSERVG